MVGGVGSPGARYRRPTTTLCAILSLKSRTPSQPIARQKRVTLGALPLRDGDLGIGGIDGEIHVGEDHVGNPAFRGTQFAVGILDDRQMSGIGFE